jgi:hypothetical protein
VISLAGGHLFPNNIRRTTAALASGLGAQVAGSTQDPKSSWWLAVLANVLILAREEVVAALLGLMVELRGMQPRFLAEGESVAAALGRDRCIVLIDCDHPACTAETIDQIRKSGSEPVLFSPFRMEGEVTNIASRYRTRFFTLPTDPDTFARFLKS